MGFQPAPEVPCGPFLRLGRIFQRVPQACKFNVPDAANRKFDYSALNRQSGIEGVSDRVPSDGRHNIIARGGTLEQTLRAQFAECVIKWPGGNPQFRG